MASVSPASAMLRLALFVVLVVVFSSSTTLVAAETIPIYSPEVTAGSCEPLHICYALDESDSILPRFYLASRRFIANSTLGLSTTLLGGQYAAVGFTNRLPVELVSPLTSNVVAFVRRVRNNPQSSGRTLSGYGLTACADLLSQTGSRNAARLIVLLSDGQDDPRPAAGVGANVAPGIKAQGIYIATVAILPHAKASSLKPLASLDSLYFTFDDVMSPETFPTTILTAIDNICLIPSPSPTPSTTQTESATSTTTATPTNTASISASTTPSVSASTTPSPSLSPSISMSTTPSITPAFGPCDTVRVCFAIDETGSINSTAFQIEKDAVVLLASGIAQRSFGTSFFSAVGFATESELISPFTSSLAEFNTAVNNTTQMLGNTASGSGLQACQDLLTSPGAAPNDLPGVVVLLTDGVDNREPAGAPVSVQLKNAGTIVAAIGIGDGGTPREDLEILVSDPRLYVSTANFSRLLFRIPDAVTQLCSLPSPAPATPTPSISPSPSMLSRPQFTSLDMLPPFDPNGSTDDNGKAARAAVEYFIAQELPGNDTLLRVDLYFEWAGSDLFPWNVLNGDYFTNPKATPTATAFPTFIDSERTERFSSAQSMNHAVQRYIRTRVSTCPTGWCAARIEVNSNKRISWNVARNAINGVRSRPGFRDSFSVNRDKFRIVRRNPLYFISFFPFPQPTDV